MNKHSATRTSHARLVELEAVIEHGLQTFVDVGNALLEIRDSRLYKAHYTTFEDYCRERWQLTRRHSNRLVAAAAAVANLGPIGPKAPINEAQARPLTRFNDQPDVQRQVWQTAVETAPNGKVTAAHITAVAETYREPHELLNQSESNEWYTPAPYVDAARAVMGGIDLDPASCEFANKTVKAKQFYTQEQNGLLKYWRGRVWLNPPYGRDDNNNSNQSVWSRKLINEYKHGGVEAAVLLVNAVPGNKWFSPLWEFPICFVDHRIRFYNQQTDTGQPTQSNALVYLGKDNDRFADFFSKFGVVAVRYQ